MIYRKYGSTHMTFEYNKDIYSKTALIKAAYHFTDKAYLHLDSDGEKYIVCIEPKPNISIDEKDFENEILAQVARLEIYRQTKNIREISFARALASSVVELAQDNETLKETIDTEAASILKDWFERQ